MARFTDRVFLISGGARGLGEAQARALVAEGAKVVIGDVLAEQGRQLSGQLGPACVFQQLDVTSEAAWSDALATELLRRGRSAQELQSASKSSAWTLELALALRRTTTVTNRWLGEHLHLGGRDYVSRRLSLRGGIRS